MSEWCNDCGADDGYTAGRTLPLLRDWLASGRGEVDWGWLLLLVQFLHTARGRDYFGGGLLPSHWLWGAAYS